MDSYGQLVHVEELHRDGVHYRVAVFSVKGGLHAEWSCSGCAMTDKNGVHPTVEQSVAATKKLIDKHHRNNHFASSSRDTDSPSAPSGFGS